MCVCVCACVCAYVCVCVYECAHVLQRTARQIHTHRRAIEVGLGNECDMRRQKWARKGGNLCPVPGFRVSGFWFRVYGLEFRGNLSPVSGVDDVVVDDGEVPV